MKDRFKVDCTHKDYKQVEHKPSFDAVLGYDKSFINLRFIPRDKTNEGKRWLDSDYISQETFALRDIRKIVKGLQSLLKQSKDKK
jgi:hypothetical protein